MDESCMMVEISSSGIKSKRMALPSMIAKYNDLFRQGDITIKTWVATRRVQVLPKDKQIELMELGFYRFLYANLILNARIINCVI